MGKVLLITSGIGPVEGAIHTAIRSAPHDVVTYDIAGRWTSGPPMPQWMAGYRQQLSPMARNLFAKVMEPMGFDTVVTIGVDAAAFAANNVPGDFIPLLHAGSLDFAGSTATKTSAFRMLLRRTDRLLLENDRLMDLACAKGSLLPHLQLPRPAFNPVPMLTSEERRVVVLHPDAMTEEELEETIELLQAGLDDDVEIETKRIGSLYQHFDLVRGRAIHDIMRFRLAEFSHAVVLGWTQHHSTILQQLSQSADQVVVEHTINAMQILPKLGLHRIGRGTQLPVALRDMLRSGNARRASATHADSGSREAAPHVADYVAQLRGLMTREVAPLHEELEAVDFHGPLDIFFSVAAIEERSNGARPQRLRNFQEALNADSPRLFLPSGPAMRRRIALAQTLIAEGREPRMLYGENSTSPMTKDLVDQLAGFLESFRDKGGRSMWFVRDLHWLEESEVLGREAERLQIMRENGLHELNKIGSVVDVLAAPSRSAGDGFNGLLRAHGQPERDWFPLPPAVHEVSSSSPEDFNIENTGYTLLYAGGHSDFYGLDDYVAFAATLPSEAKLDFVVRPGEQESLEVLLEQHGIAVEEQCRIMSTTLERYLPRTRRCIGIILLDSGYARISFPYKTASMIERGFPILCYEDMGIASYVRENGVGIAAARSHEALRSAVEQLVRDGAPGLEEAQQKETWEARVAAVAKILQSA